jgi:nucleotide-binding universal stress UspA family protein
LVVPKKIAFATNYLNNEMETLKAINKLAAKLEAELLIFHVSKKNSKSDRDVIEQLSNSIALETGLTEPFYYVLPNNDVQKGIELFIDSAGADLIGLSTRRRAAFEKLFDGSLTKKIACHSPVPLLAFHSLAS